MTLCWVRLHNEYVTAVYLAGRDLLRSYPYWTLLFTLAIGSYVRSCLKGLQSLQDRQLIIRMRNRHLRLKWSFWGLHGSKNSMETYCFQETPPCPEIHVIPLTDADWLPTSSGLRGWLWPGPWGELCCSVQMLDIGRSSLSWSLDLRWNAEAHHFTVLSIFSITQLVD